MTALLILKMLMPNISEASGSKRQDIPAPEAPKPVVSTCDSVLDKCRKAVNDQILLNHKQQIEIKANEDLVKTQREKIDQLEKENNSILKSPWLWIGVGLIGGQLLLNGSKR